jgi:hypothetical protein
MTHTIHQRAGIEKYKSIAQGARYDFRNAVNAKAVQPTETTTKTGGAEHAWMITILALFGFVVLISQIFDLAELDQRKRDASHACEAQGLTAIAVNRNGHDDIVCVGGAR